MSVTTATVSVAILAISAIVTATLAAYAYRHRREPGAVPFALLMLSLVVWSLAYAVGLVTPDPFWRFFWLRVMWFGPATINVWVFLFALTYTGHGDFVTRRTVALLGVIPSLVVVAVWTNPWHHLMWTRQSVVLVDGLAVMDPSFGPVFWIQVVYSYGLIVVGATLLLRLIYQSDYLYTDQSVLLLVGIGAPLALNVADVFAALPQPGVDYTPHAFTVTGLAFGYALFRRQLFDLVPATRQLGRDAAISQLDDGVIIVDNAQRIVYCNAAAGELLDCDPSDTLGVAVHSLVDEARLDFGAEDALAEIERDGRTYEVRTSPIDDRRDRRIGHTLVVHDVTARKERERRLAAQRDELATVNDLNAVIRGVNQGLVSATSREEIERTVCEHVAAADLYRTACVGDIPTWTGEADRWFVAGDGGAPGPSPPTIDDEGLQRGERDDSRRSGTLPIVPGQEDGGGTWTVAPIVYGRTVYGALGLYTDRTDVSDRERDVVGELGEIVGHAINAVESRRLLSAEAVVELELRSEDEDDLLVAASARADCRLDVAGVVPGRDGADVAYVHVQGGDPEAVHDRMSGAATVRTIRDEGDEGLLEWQVTDDSVLRSLDEHGANVLRASADGGTVSYELEVASDAAVRSLVDHLERRFPDTRVVSKRECARPTDRVDALAGDGLADLTERQREAIEAAYRAGYFNWPRDSTAEEVAETLDIASATLHSHLRKAQQSLLDDIFDRDAGAS